MKTSQSKFSGTRSSTKPALWCVMALILIGLASYAQNTNAQASWDYLTLQHYAFNIQHYHSSDAAVFGYLKFATINADGNFTATFEYVSGGKEVPVKGTIKIVNNHCIPTCTVFALSFSFENYMYECTYWKEKEYFAGTYSTTPVKQPAVNRALNSFTAMPFCGIAYSIPW